MNLSEKIDYLVGRQPFHDILQLELTIKNDSNVSSMQNKRRLLAIFNNKSNKIWLENNKWHNICIYQDCDRIIISEYNYMRNTSVSSSHFIVEMRSGEYTADHIAQKTQIMRFIDNFTCLFEKAGLEIFSIAFFTRV